LPFLVALAVTKGRITMDELTTSLHDDRTLELALRVEPVDDPRFGADNRIGPARVEFDLRDGTKLHKEIAEVYGGRRRPMSWDDLAAKFRSCAACSPTPLDPSTVDRMIDRIAGLEDVADVAELVRHVR
jgi:2-methylcitrate dehydratase PrpD